MKKTIYLAVGWLSFALGLVGIALPLVPTVPFMILTGYCFYRGSENLHRWLLELPGIGEPLRDWEQNRKIRRPAKIKASVVLVAGIGSSLWFLSENWIHQALLLTTAAGVLIFLWTRKE